MFIHKPIQSLIHYYQVNKDYGKAVPVLNYAPCHDDAWESGGTMPCIPNFNHTGKCKVSSALQPSCPSIYLTQGLVGLSANLDTGEKIYGCYQETNDNSSIVQLIVESIY